MSVYDKFKKSNKKNFFHQRNTGPIIPKNNLVATANKAAIKQGKLVKCPFCGILCKDDVYLTIHLQWHHPEQSKTVLRLFRSEEIGINSKENNPNTNPS